MKKKTCDAQYTSAKTSEENRIKGGKLLPEADGKEMVKKKQQQEVFKANTSSLCLIDNIQLF